MKLLRQQAGLTLIELLAVIIIASLLGILLMNVLFTSNKQYNTQVSEAANLNELSFITKELTKDFRQSSAIEIGQQTVKFSKATYVYNTGNLKRNTSEYATKLKTFCIASTNSNFQTADCSKITVPTKKNEQGIYIYIENMDGRKVETTLFTRGGS
ncbi:MAG: prepilin-type N-terminal cleavage/methylation domain-containing protein [Kurthia sp.]|nr:prepilin-type N-terminal cleavage/methylation domain-containing protein [Candidatus Kurthia equi]